MNITQADKSQQSGCTATPSRLIGATTSAISTIFMPDALPGTTLPIYPGLVQTPNMLACILSGMVTPTHTHEKNKQQESLANAKVNARQHCVSLSCLTPHISRTPANICITLILLETTFTGLHFRHWQYGLSAFKFLWWAAKDRHVM